MSSSDGISFFPDYGEDIDQLIKYADTATYEAKRNGKNHYRIYQISKGAG
ncbi:diguanylate cyclase domain-containing protein [Ferviditalea candida]